MNATLEKFEQIINQMTQEEYALIGLSILLIFFLIYIYFLIHRKKKSREMVVNSVKVFQKTFDLSRDSVLILSDKNEVIYANKSMVKLLELEEDFVWKVWKQIPEVKVKKDWIALDKFIQENHERSKEKVLSFPQSMLKISDNNEVPINLYIDTVLMETNDEMWCNVISIQDLTQEKERSNLFFTHPLTNLPNQLQALHDLPAFYSKVHLEKNKIALILMDFDNFSMLRSIIGYEQSNEVLKKFAKYLATIGTNLNISVYHTFDNHFLLTVANLHSIEEARTFVEEVQAKIASFYKMEDVSLHLTVSAGIAVYPDSGTTRKLLDNTYKALAQAQKDGDGRIYVFIPEKSTTLYDELKLHNDMQVGLEKGEFEVYFQPIIKVDSKEIVAAEALIRWKHPQYGMIPPDVFISLMEKTGFIVKLGQYVLEEVLKQQKRWELFNFKQIEISINVSMVEIGTGEFVQNVEKQLAHHKVHPELIKFEITEGTAMISESETEKYFLDLKKLGVGISLDDFGTGYTSFTYLKKFPADTMKIDKSLVDYILTNEEDQRIVKAMIDLGHNLGMKIVVEGIENKKMVDILASYGCDYMQGYYFAKPLPVFEFQKLLR